MLVKEITCPECGNEFATEHTGGPSPSKHRCQECGNWLYHYHHSRNTGVPKGTIKLTCDLQPWSNK